MLYIPLTQLLPEALEEFEQISSLIKVVLREKLAGNSFL